MYRIIFTILFFLIAVSLSVAQEQILRLPPFSVSGQYLNQQIGADTVANGKLPNRVYELQRGGIYIVDTEIVNYNWTLRIRANDSITTQKTIIMLHPSHITKVVPHNFINVQGNVELKNLLITGYYELIDTNLRSGLQGNILGLSATPSNWKISIDSCILSNTDGKHILINQNMSVLKLTNTIMANMGYLGISNLGAGKGIDLRDHAIDTLIIQNCTFVNWQDRIIRHYYEHPEIPPYTPTSPIGYLLFDHNTLVNGMSYYGLFALGKTGSQAIITNNLFIDPFSLGNDTAYDRQIEYASSGEKDSYGHNRITWIFSEANDATQWTISNNYYAISDSGQAFYDQYASEGVMGEGSPLTWYINSKLGADSINAFKKITISPNTVPSLMTKLMRWYRSPSGGDKRRTTPGNWVFGDPDVHPYSDPNDYDRKGYEWLQNSLNCSYYASEAPTSNDGKVVGDTRWDYLGIIVVPDEPPEAPQNLAGTAGYEQVSLRWNKNSEADGARYRIYYGTTSPATTLKDSTASILDTTKLIIGLTNGITYYFRLTAVDNAGNESGYSNEVSVTPVYVENILRLPPYAQSAKYLNQQIGADTVANGKLPNRVYELQRGGIYRMNTNISTYNWTLRIRANDSTTAQKAVIMIHPSHLFDAKGDIELKNLLITGYYELSDTNLRSASGILIRIPSTPTKWNVNVDSCILSNTCGQPIRIEANVSVLKVTNTIFANLGYLGQSNLGAGKGIDLRDRSVDSLIIQNCTFVNWQDRIIRHYYATYPYTTSFPIDYLLFDHNTLINGMSYMGMLSLGKMGDRAIITNNLLIDPFSLGNDTCADRQIEFTTSGEKDEYGQNRMTWIFSEPTVETQWTISNNYYAISDSGQAFYNQYAYAGVTGEGSPLTWYINSKLGADSINAFKKIHVEAIKIPRLMTNLMRWYRSPFGGNKTRNTPAAWVFGDPNVHPYSDPFDFDRKGYQWLQDSLNCSYYATGSPTSNDGKVVGDTRWNYYPLSGWTNSISGKVFNDINGNCTQDDGESGLPGCIIRLEPGPIYSITNSNGEYSFNPLNSGSYIISELPNVYWEQICPSSPATYSVVVTHGENIIGKNFANQQSYLPFQDLTISVGRSYPSPLRSPCCGRNMFYQINYSNRGTATVTNATIQLQLSTYAQYIATTSSNPTLNPPTQLPGNMLVYSLVNPLLPGASGSINVTVLLTCPVPTSPMINTYASIEPIASDAYQDNNIYYAMDKVRCSYDPNDISVTPEGCGVQGYITKGDSLTYTIRFQNLGSGPAYYIVVRDVLDSDLDINSIINLGSSHPNVFEKNGNELIWTFPDMELPPASSDEPGSHGYIIYRTKQMPDNPIGTVIENNASVYFDLNDPVVTNTTVNTITNSPMPIASFTISSDTSATPRIYTFNYTGGTIGATYSWDFGYGAVPQISTDENPTGIIYAQPGLKVISLVVTLGDCVSEPTATTVTVDVDSTTLNLSSGWNLVSVPRVQSNYNAGFIFPNKSGSMFAYNTALRDYKTAPILANGPGYWLNNSRADTVHISGAAPGSLTDTAFQAGWVLVGSCDTTVHVSSLILSDGATRLGSVFLYDAVGKIYNPVTVINPGEAVWINVNKACTITIP